MKRVNNEQKITLRSKEEEDEIWDVINYDERISSEDRKGLLKIKVRRALLEDAKSLGHIIVESWRSAYEDIIPKDEITKFLDKNRRQQQFERFIKEDEIVLIGFYEDIPCGLVFANKDNDEELTACGSIYSIYLLEKYWGKGLATSLMKEAINILRTEGCKEVMLWVYEANKRAIGFYEKLGFKFDGSKKHSHFSNKPIEMRYRMKI